MNYIEIDFSKVKGYNKLSDKSKRLFEEIYKRHNSIVGSYYKEDYKPIKVREHKNYVEVHFNNGDWLHYYSNGTWGYGGEVMEVFVCSAMSPIIAFVLAVLYITALAIDMKRSEDED